MTQQLHFRKNKTRITFQIGTGTSLVYTLRKLKGGEAGIGGSFSTVILQKEKEVTN